MVSSTDHLTGKTGLAPAVEIARNGGLSQLRSPSAIRRTPTSRRDSAGESSWAIPSRSRRPPESPPPRLHPRFTHRPDREDLEAEDRRQVKGIPADEFGGFCGQLGFGGGAPGHTAA